MSAVKPITGVCIFLFFALRCRRATSAERVVGANFKNQMLRKRLIFDLSVGLGMLNQVNAVAYSCTVPWVQYHVAIGEV